MLKKSNKSRTLPIGRAVLFVILGVVEGAVLGAVSVPALVSTGAGTDFDASGEAAAY
jgi:hypothetical protein